MKDNTGYSSSLKYLEKHPHTKQSCHRGAVFSVSFLARSSLEAVFNVVKYLFLLLSKAQKNVFYLK